jgi:phosphoribosylaminoimidazole-succinocarboxamide synthase
MTPALHQSSLNSIPLINRGKVRDLYQLDDQHLLIVTTDRISAFDVILPTPIPGKGRILANMAQFWFRHTQGIIRNHLASDLSLSDYLTPDELAQLDGRGVVVGRYTPLPIEAIVRGYLVGSGWKEYQQSQSVCGLALPAGLQLAQQLPEALFTPSSKADVGDHDENITYQQMVAKIGPDLAAQVRDISLKLYQSAAEFALARGIIIADTKFEFGLDEQGELVLIDEILTPDSSRFWPAKDYAMGSNPPSFDKQFVRDYLETLDWDKTAPGPELPDSVVKATLTKYQEAQARLTEN